MQQEAEGSASFDLAGHRCALHFRGAVRGCDLYAKRETLLSIYRDKMLLSLSLDASEKSRDAFA
jgi:hypothetical protein